MRAPAGTRVQRRLSWRARRKASRGRDGAATGWFRYAGQQLGAGVVIGCEKAPLGGLRDRWSSRKANIRASHGCAGCRASA